MDAPQCQTGASPQSGRNPTAYTLRLRLRNPQQIVTQHKPPRLSRHKKSRARGLKPPRVSADTYLIAERIVKTYPVVNDKGQRQRLYRALWRTLIRDKTSWSPRRPQCLLSRPGMYIHYRPKIFFQYLASSVPYVRISTIKRVTYVTFTKYYRSVFVFERVSIYVTINERQARSEFI